MDEQIKALLNQVRILETEANNHTGNERAELFKAAGKLKDQVATLLNQHGKGQQQQESKVPDPNAYFSAQLPEGFENYFGDYLTPEIEDYFNNLTPEQRDYFTVQVPDNAPDAPKQKQEPAKTGEFYDWETRRRILNALGIPC
ncbi:hypothetical protein HZ878_004783 [Escherichia coli]|nr:hypothetical protein [Escherichia coli]EFQ7648153.1 hypothetical protein [Escherichia coli]